MKEGEGELWRYGVEAVNAPVPVIIITPPTHPPTPSPHFEENVLDFYGPVPSHKDIELPPPSF